MRKYVNPVNLFKSFLKGICLQKSDSIQPRTSGSKFESDSINFFNSRLGPPRAAFVPRPACRDAGDAVAAGGPAEGEGQRRGCHAVLPDGDVQARGEACGEPQN